MDYKGLLCPVCHRVFEKDDDIVVCPECGTPHHRECYEATNNCINAHRHRENFNFKRELEVNSDVNDKVNCMFCGADNPQNSRFCNSCGRPISISNINSNTDSDKKTSPENSHDSFDGAFIIDPLGGVKGDEELGENVTASDTSRFVKTSTTFYIPQFKRIRNGAKARFSFVGFIFGGGWMLYRKMYKSGALITALMALLTFANLYLSVCHSSAVNAVGEMYSRFMTDVYQNYGYNIYSALGDFFTSLTNEQLIVCIVSTLISVLMILIRVLCGIFGNRWYYNHCIKSINKIKSTGESEKGINEKLSTKGGVNVGLAFSLMISYYIVVYLPMFF